VTTRAPGLLTINGGSSGIRFAVFTAAAPPPPGQAPGAE
jgi:hypothetical protein